MKEYLEIGKIVSTHGLNGEVNVIPWCNSVNFLCDKKILYLDSGKSSINISSARPHKNVAILKIKDIDSIEQAEKLKNKILFINKNEIKLNKNEYFIQDIIGLNVVNKNTDKYYGKIIDVIQTGANDVYEIINNNNKYYVPVISKVVKEINLSENKVLITPIEGLFDSEN